MLFLVTKQDRHPIDFDTAGTVEMVMAAFVLGLEVPLLFIIMARQGTTLLVPVGILVFTVFLVLLKINTLRIFGCRSDLHLHDYLYDGSSSQMQMFFLVLNTSSTCVL